MDKGARIDVWNTRNEYGWTPLTIARGYRFGNFKPSPVTIEAIEKVMLSAGIVPPSEKEENAKGFDIYAPENIQRRRAPANQAPSTSQTPQP
jgi:hypothetical protein